MEGVLVLVGEHEEGRGLVAGHAFLYAPAQVLYICVNNENRRALYIWVGTWFST